MNTVALFRWASALDQAAMAALVRSGGVIAGSSDTVIGLLALASQEGFLALNEIKKREDKPYLLLVDSVERVLEYAQLPLAPWVRTLIDAVWPGPLTIVVKARKDLPAWLIAVDGTIAVRMPKHAGLQELIRVVGPLFSTSANLSGCQVPTTLDTIDATIVERISGLVTDEGSAQDDKRPSTIVDCTGDRPRIIRQGAIVVSL